jgi:phospholipid/cholesterol/gamma-HCH transport system substrate-binding protein
MRLAFTERRPWLIGITCLVVLIAGTSVAFSFTKFKGLRGVYSLSAELEDAAGLQPGNEVRIAGVRVGNVTKVSLEPEAAVVEMEVEEAIQIPRETLLEVKLKTLLGQKFIDLQFPRSFIAAVSTGSDPADATAGFLADGDRFPLGQTSVPFEVYQAATGGTDVLEQIDKKALRTMLRVLGSTVGTSKAEIGRALEALAGAGEVLGDKSGSITRLLRNLNDVSGILADNDQELDGILAGGSDVLGVLADRRATIGSLLAAADDLGKTLGLLIRSARVPLALGVTDLNSILVTAEGSLDELEVALDELGPAQRLFGIPLQFGRFTEGHVCAVTTEDTCVPGRPPEDPGFPVKGTQPSPPPGGVI